MGRPGKLNLRTSVIGSNGKISFTNYIAKNLAKKLANEAKIASASINYMSKDDLYSKFIKRRKDIDSNGFFDVILHGSKSYVCVNLNGKKIFINHRTLSKLIISNIKGKKVSGIRLLSCNTGAKEDGFAQLLADKLHMPVLAPTKYSFVKSNGVHFVAGSRDGGKNPDYSDLGEFKMFYPRRERK